MAKSSHCGRVVTEDSNVSEPSRAGHSLLSCYLVEALQVSNRRRLWPIVGIFVLEMSDQHSKLGAPVAEVVQLQDVVTHERHQVWYALTYDCWPASFTQTQSPVVCNSTTECRRETASKSDKIGNSPANVSYIFLNRTLIRQKLAHTRLPSVGFQSWFRFLAVSLQVTWVINPAVGCHYFPPSLQLPAQPLRGLLPVSLLGEQRHNGCKQFA